MNLTKRTAANFIRVLSMIVVSVLVSTLAISIAPASTAAAAPAPQWITAWGTAPTDGDSLGGCNSCTIRNTTKLTLAGSRVRVTLSNRFGTEPLTVGHTTVSRPAGVGFASAVAGSVRDVTFGGSSSVTIPVGGYKTSDPVDYDVVAGSSLHVTTFTPGSVPRFTRHMDAHHKTFRAAGSDLAATTTGSSFTADNNSNYIVTGVDVDNAQAQGAIVTFGDSITDGSGTDFGADNRWGDLLAKRLSALQPDKQLSVVNSGISANRLLLDGYAPNAGIKGLDRFNDDVLSRSGVKAVVLFIGINDIQQSPSQTNPNAITAGLKDVAQRAKANNIRVIGATITPWRGWGTYNDEREATRVAVNNWIRTTALEQGIYDSVVDFDSVTRNSLDTSRLLPAYDSGDKLHPSPLGYSAMANSIDLSKFTGTDPYQAGSWAGAWGAAPAIGGGTFGDCNDCTIRNVVRLSASGSAAQVVLSNVFGTETLRVQNTTVSLPVVPGSAAAQPNSMTSVTFAGSSSVDIPAGQQVTSDPIAIAVEAGTDLHVSTFTPGKRTFDRHVEAAHTTYRSSGAGDKSADTSANAFSSGSETSTYLVTRVDVRNDNLKGTVVAFGDSITDGAGSTVNANNRWPDLLAERIGKLPQGDRFGVVNSGIGGNRILRDNDSGQIGGPSAMARFQRDVLNVPGVKTVILMEGINDIQWTGETNPDRIAAGMRVLVSAAKARGIRVVGATMTPWSGAPGYTAEREVVRQAVNEWIRSSSIFDAVLDFDRATQNPQNTAAFLPSFNSGDGIHPGPAGYAAMAKSIDLGALGLYPSLGKVQFSDGISPASGGAVTMKAKFTPAANGSAGVTLQTPTAWTLDKPAKQELTGLVAGVPVEVSWRAKVPVSAGSAAQIVVTADVGGRETSQAKTFSIEPRPLAGSVNISDRPLKSVQVGWGVLHRDEDMNGGPIDIAGTVYPKGFVANANAELAFDLSGSSCTSFSTVVGVDPNSNGPAEGSVTFEFLTDGNMVRKVGSNSDPIRATSPATNVTIDVTGVSTLVLRATDAGNGAASDHAAWGQPTLQCGPANLPVPVATISAGDDQVTPSGWNLSPLTVSVKGSGGSGDLATEYRVGTGAWRSADSAFSVEDGVSTIAARVTDRWGTQSVDVQRVFKIDSAAPVVSADFNKTQRQLTITGTDAVSGVKGIEYRRADQGTWTAYSQPIATGDRAESFYFRASDVAGNVSSENSIFVPAVQPTNPNPSDTRPESKVGAKLTGVATWGQSGVIDVDVRSSKKVTSGTVTLEQGGVNIGRAAVSDGKARIYLPADLKVGKQTITAKFSGNDSVRPSSGVVYFTVVKAASGLKVAVKGKSAKATRKKGSVAVTVNVKSPQGVKVAGKAKVVIKRGKKVIAKKTITVSTRKKVTSFKSAKLKRGKYKVSVTFLGSPTVKSTTQSKSLKLR